MPDGVFRTFTVTLADYWKRVFWQARIPKTHFLWLVQIHNWVNSAIFITTTKVERVTHCTCPKFLTVVCNEKLVVVELVIFPRVKYYWLCKDGTFTVWFNFVQRRYARLSLFWNQTDKVFRFFWMTKGISLPLSKVIVPWHCRSKMSFGFLI